MNLGDRVNAVLARMLLLQSGSVTDYTRDALSHGKPGSTILGHGRSVPLAVEWAERFARMLALAERDHERAIRRDEGTPPTQDKVSKRRISRNAAILHEEGMDPTWVAACFGMTTQGVEQLRRRNGLDPATGERVRKDTLTPSLRDKRRDESAIERSEQ